jgi:two-component system NtrC family sensor kinase
LEDSFQRLLLDFSLAGSLRGTPASLIHLFLRSTREFFGVDGAYFWRKSAADVLVGEEADGAFAEQFRGLRLSNDESAVTAEAVRSGHTVFVNDIDYRRYPLAERFQVRSLMAAPLVVAGEALGSVVFLHTSDPQFFNDDMAAKATILAGQLGSLLEAQRLYAAANAQANELHQLLEISSELGSSSKLDEFLKKFVVRAAEFLGFARSYIALLEGDTCQVRWVAENGQAHPLEVSFAAEAAARVLSSKEVFWTDDIRQVPEADQESAAQHNVRQVLTVPLLSSDGRNLGMFGVLDRLDQAGISAEDIRRARALAAPVAVALEAARNLDLTHQHRRRAEDLTAMALELNSLLRLPEFAQSFTARAAEMLGAGSAALAVMQRSRLEIVGARIPDPAADKGVMRRLAVALSDLLADHRETIMAGQASDLLGHVASALDWRDVVLACLHGSDSELIGIVCLANRGKPLTSDDQDLLQALAGHAAVALEKARLFTRMDQANRHWMELFDAISDFIVVHDGQCKVLRVNRSMAEFIGVRPAELIGISMRALLESAAQAGPQPCPFCRPGGEPTDEFVHPVLERTYLVSTSRVHGPNNEGLQTIHVLKDISDRREAERRYRELFDNIQEGLYFTSTDGRFIEVNDALVRMLGYSSREELLQVDIPSQVYFDPLAREGFRARIEAAGVVRNYEETLRRKDGAPINTLQNAFAVRDGQGKVTQYRGLILDITELKNSQAELQRERDFNNKILNNTQSIILVTDTAGQITYANRRWYESGAYNPQQWLGQPLLEMVVPARREALRAALEDTLAGQQVDSLELPLTRGDGRPGQFSVNLSPMRDEQGEVSSVVVVMTDISDTALMQSKLMHAEKMAAVGQLVSGVAHEVNNPLTAILGFADLLMENPELPESAHKDLRVILQEAQRTKHIVQNLLSFARQMPPQRKPVQVNSILRRTLQLRAYDFSSHGVEVSERLYEPLPEVIGDSQQLQQVFLNILNNAYDAVRDTGRPARIETETAVVDGWVQVLFRDNGNGITNPERIFDPFFTTKEVGKGTGLGLSICYGIVREHGGEILCHNNMGREGATFVVRLPLTAEMAQIVATAGAMES